jgi:heme-degrading monooxygenase HmoA
VAATTIVGMSIIRINAITVPAEAGDELAHRFAARAGAVDGAEGFEGFELLKPTDGRTQWLVITRWRDEAAFEAWLSSPAFAHGHRGAGGGGGHPGGGHPGGGHPGGQAGGTDAAPVGVASEVWAYEPVVSAEPTS